MATGIQICSGSEWRATRALLPMPSATLGQYPYGQFLQLVVAETDCVLFHSRRTKTRAAGACQYAIGRWKLDSLLVLGTCGGVAEHLQIGDLVFADRTIQYDCQDQRPDMGLIAVADRDWFDLRKLDARVHVGTIATADHDFTFADLPALRVQGVLAADWESGAIATVCELNCVRWAILRGVSDKPQVAGEADMRRQLLDYQSNTPAIMRQLIEMLPQLVSCFRSPSAG